MFTYALAKGVRTGYLPQSDEAHAKRAWDGIQKQFVTANPDGALILHGTVKVGGLGGTPYRAGDFAYYVHEAVVDQDPKGRRLPAGRLRDGAGNHRSSGPAPDRPHG
jgi:unsaturated rhamnogalacturonyl hydrolase